LELGARIYFARQNAVIPLIGSAINLVVYILFGALLTNPMGATGIALADAAAFTAQSGFLFLTFGVITLKEKQIQPSFKHLWQIGAGQPDTRDTFLRALLGSVVGGLVILLMLNTLNAILPSLVVGLLAALAGMTIALLFVKKELKILVSL
jgi:putative peptidoglycan lipid II flippase